MERLEFAVTRLAAVAPQGLPLTWQGRSFSSGPLHVELDSLPSTGSLDYSTGRAAVDFNVRLRFPEFSDLLLSLGVDPALTAPVSAKLHSDGPINPDHSFSLSGDAWLADHALLDARQTSARILPGT
jgi:hypothetical protein